MNIAKAATVVSSLLKAQTDDANEALQYAKNTSGQKTELLTRNEELILNKQLERLLYNIDFLLNVNNFNKGNKILDSKQTFVKLGKSLLFNLAPGNKKIMYTVKHGDGTTEQVNLLSGVLSQQEADKMNNIKDSSTDADDNKSIWDVVKTVNTRLADNFSKLNNEQKQEVIAQLAGDGVFTRDYEPTVIDKDITQDKLKADFLINYILLNALTPSKLQEQFWDDLSNEIAIANMYPFAGQLLDIYMTWLWA